MQLHQVFAVGEMGFTAQHDSNGSKSEVFLPARHVRCTLKSGRRQAQAEVHSIARVSSHPYPAQHAKNGPGLLQRLLARDGDVVPVEIFGWPVVRESHLETAQFGTASCLMMRIWSVIASKRLFAAIRDLTAIVVS